MLAARIVALLVAAAYTLYWGAVLVKLVRLARKIGKDPNAMPRERVGQLMRVVWYPAVLVLLGALWLAGTAGTSWHFERGHPDFWLWITPTFPIGYGYGALWLPAAIVATLVIAVGTAFTFVCWRKMGRSWRIGIDPHEKLEMITAGPYRLVRHPIYAVRMFMNLAAMVAVPTLPVAVPALLDLLLLQVEARREERYMIATHGQAYESYKKNVGRFVPRLGPV